MSRDKPEYLTSGVERASYGLYFVGQNIFYMLLMIFLVTYFTDVGIPAAAVGVITLVVKIWDAINDPIFGGIVDKVKFRDGKFLPWLRISLIAIPIATVLLFAIPAGLSLTAKIVWAALGYILWDTAYTICDVPIFGIVTTLTSKVAERTSLIAIGRVAALLAAGMVGVVVPLARTAIGGWLMMALVLSVVALGTMVPICFTAKERIQPQSAATETTLQNMVLFVVRNKYMLICFGALLVYGAASIHTGYALYTARFLLGDEGLATILMLLSIAPSIVLGVFVPAITRRVDKYYLFIWAMIAMALLSIPAYFVGYRNVTFFFIMQVVRFLPMGIIAVVMFMFTPDCAEYGLYKTGISAPGISFSIQTFTAKMTGALSASLGAFALAAIGFVSGENAVQPTGFNDAFWVISNIIPVVGCTLAVLILTRYKLRDKYVQIMARHNAGEITRDEAEELLAGKI